MGCPRLFLFLALAAVAVAGESPGSLHHHLGLPYFHGKYGFRSVVEAKNHAYKEYLALVGAGRIDPAQGEYFSYLYTIRDPARGAITWFHSEFEKATYLHTQGGQEVYQVRSPIAESENIRRNTFIHTHPRGRTGGEWPSRTDVAVASRYRHRDGRYRYLYLINSRLQLVQFKAVRSIDPENRLALQQLPHLPVRGRDWRD
jgi:hypothetical protein